MKLDTARVQSIIETSYKLKPDKLYMSELKWKYLVRSAMRGKNILLIGSTGQGKTLSVKCLRDALAHSGDVRELFVINMGATQDSRASLIGNTHFSKDTGTFFSPSPFVSAITTPNSIVLLDELSRANPDASNILMTVLDPIQRYLRLDEKLGGEIVNVAENVTFVATANVGNEYTATRVMDRALIDRFTVKIEMDIPVLEDELNLVKLHCPEANMDIMESIVNIANTTRGFTKEGKLSKFVSTRSVIEMAELSVDGFSLVEMAEMVIYPDYPDDGGVDSERTMVKQAVQKYIKESEDKAAWPSTPKNIPPDEEDPPF